MRCRGAAAEMAGENGGGVEWKRGRISIPWKSGCTVCGVCVCLDTNAASNFKLSVCERRRHARDTAEKSLTIRPCRRRTTNSATLHTQPTTSHAPSAQAASRTSTRPCPQTSASSPTPRSDRNPAALTAHPFPMPPCLAHRRRSPCRSPCRRVSSCTSCRGTRCRRAR